MAFSRDVLLDNTRSIEERVDYIIENMTLEYWLFSFSNYFDPHNIQFGALRVFV